MNAGGHLTSAGIAAALAALVAEGKNFDRAELDAMLDKLAASPTPKSVICVMATCYVSALPRPEPFEYVCKNCGAHTSYPPTSRQIGNALHRLRDGAASLRALGLDIVLDESPLCRRCHSAEELGIPTAGRVVALRPDESAWRTGDEVAIDIYSSYTSYVRPLNLEYWINAQYIDKDGNVTGDNVNLRFRPSTRGLRLAIVQKGARLVRLPAREGDPVDWVRVAEPEEDPDRILLFNSKTSIRTRFLGDLQYIENNEASPARFDRLAWVINGKRTRAESSDIDLLKSFLAGEDFVGSVFNGKVPVKTWLPRLYDLLGPASESEPLAPKITDGRDGEVNVEVDI